MKKIFAMLSILCLIMTSCTSKQTIQLPTVDDYDKPKIEVDRKNLKLGVVTGPYGDMFMEAVMPTLALKGYTVTLVNYNDYDKPNRALANSEIDMNMFQHYIYLNNFKFENDLALSAITEIPTASMGVFSHKYAKLEDVEQGGIVSGPSDPTNLLRALKVLEASGIITLHLSSDKTRATLEDIEKNPKNLKFVLVEAQAIVNSYSSYDLSVINGNFALAGGLDLTEALYNEILDEGYMNVVAVRTEDLDKQFVQDILDAIHSDAFRMVIQDETKKYHGFQRPRSF